MDTLDKIIVVIIAISLAAFSALFSISYTDKKICELKGGMMINGACVEVIKK